MSRLLYSLLFYLLVPFILLRLLYRSVRAPAYARRWQERFGWFSIPATFRRGKKPIWVHAVSVGETLASVPLIKALQARHPDRELVVTTMTPTGSERVQQIFGDTVFHVYLPYDLPGAAARFIARIDPALLIIMETELWPNLLHHCQRAGVRTMLANARLSARSAQGYARFGGLVRQMLRRLDVIAAQSPEDAHRFVELGVEPEQVKIAGSVKFDVDPPRLNEGDLPTPFRQIRALQKSVLIAASTRDSEEQYVLSAFKQCLEKHPNLLLVLVPRHPERFNAVARLCEESGLRCARRSSSAQLPDDIQIFLGDSMGEMWLYYSLADIAFVGGSLVDTGCHNVLEPAALGLPVLAGPSQYNFQAICNQLQKAGALITVMDAEDLGAQVVALLDNSQWRGNMGTAGSELVQANRGSLEKIVGLAEAQLETLS